MEIAKLMDAITERFGCVCELESDGSTVLLETYSPEGQDVVFEFELTSDSSSQAEEYVRALQEYADAYDPDEEAALWIGSDGHGKNGAPYRLRDLLDDMDWCQKWFQNVAAFACEWLNNQDKPKHNYRVPLIWQMCGYVTVEAHNEQEAAEIALGPDTPLPEGEYVDDSCKTDDDLSIENLGQVEK